MWAKKPNPTGPTNFILIFFFVIRFNNKKFFKEKTASRITLNFRSC
jgi:hypothetical protein